MGRLPIRGLLVVLLFLASRPALGSATYLSVPLDSPVYDELEHFRALGYWRGSLEVRPITRRTAEQAVSSIEARAADSPLGAGDLLRLRRLRAELAGLGPELPATAESAPPPAASSASSDLLGEALPPVSWEIGAALQYHGQATNLDSLADLDRRPRHDGGAFVHINAAVGRRLTAEFRTYEDYSRLSPEPGGGHYVDNMPLSGKGILTDPSARNDVALLGLHSGWYDIEYGREDRRWGPGRRGSLFLSENPFPLDGLSFRFRSRYFSGVSLFAQTLRSPNGKYPPDTSVVHGQNGDAYMAAHRFEFHPPGRFAFGFFESVIWGGRGPDLGYVNPIGFLVALTQDIYDRSGADDKKILGADLTVRLTPVTLYGEFLLNRLVTLNAADAGERSQISSYAEQLGLRWADPLGVAGSDLDAEYTHLDPEVYFHKDGDPRRDYLTQGELIGYWAGPNSDDLCLSWNAPPVDRWGVFGLQFEQVRWGLINGLRGLQAGFVGLEKKDKHWISGSAIQVERCELVRWTRNDWRAPWRGAFDTVVTLGRIDRTGAWSGSGWQGELRLRYHLQFNLLDAGGR